MVGLTMIRPSLISLRTLVREFALPISFCSDGSSPTDPQNVPSKSSARYGATRERRTAQILRLPTPATDAASRFWDRRLTIGLECADTIKDARRKWSQLRCCDD